LLTLLGAHHIFHVSGLRVNDQPSMWFIEIASVGGQCAT